MGCCHSSFLEPRPNPDGKPASAAGALPSADTTGFAAAFSEFSLADLRAATNNFSSDLIVSESGEKAPNAVYKGRLQSSRRWIAVKKFTKLAWPDPKQFAVFTISPLQILFSPFAIFTFSSLPCSVFKWGGLLSCCYPILTCC